MTRATQLPWKQLIIALIVALFGGAGTIAYSAVADTGKNTVILEEHSRRLLECEKNHRAVIKRIDDRTDALSKKMNRIDSKLNQLTGFLKGKFQN